MCYHVINRGNARGDVYHKDEHLLTVLRYVERNPVRADVVERAEQWAWSSTAMWGKSELPAWLHVGPVRQEGSWLRQVHGPQTVAEEAALRKCVSRGSPYGGPVWQQLTARRLGLEFSLRSRGRPRMNSEK